MPNTLGGMNLDKNLDKSENTPLTNRINELAKKAKTTGLTDDELKERTELREQYLSNFRKNFKNDILDKIYIVEENGDHTKLTNND